MAGHVSAFRGIIIHYNICIMDMIVEIKSRLLLGSRLFIMIGIKGLPEPFAANAEFVKVYFCAHQRLKLL